MSCACVNVAMGSYANSVVIPIPPHMESYRAGRERAGLSGTVGVDRCIVEEIQALWNLGIRTYGSCCGHNQNPTGMVNVAEEDIQRMKDLGYQVLPNNTRPGDEDTFVLPGPLVGR